MENFSSLSGHSESLLHRLQIIMDILFERQRDRDGRWDCTGLLTKWLVIADPEEAEANR